jgi:hypothetical protein
MEVDMSMRTLGAIVFMALFPVVVVGVAVGDWRALPFVLAGVVGFVMPVVMAWLVRA